MNRLGGMEVLIILVVSFGISVLAVMCAIALIKSSPTASPLKRFGLAVLISFLFLVAALAFVSGPSAIILFDKMDSSWRS